MKPALDIGIVIVGLNSCAYVRNCLKSLSETQWNGYTHEVIYVDNNSDDGTVEEVVQSFPHVKVIKNKENIGFCRAANQGSDLTNARYLLHLNNDTIVYQDAAPKLARLLDSTPRAAVVGCRLLNHDLTDQWSARRFPSPINAIWGRRSLLSKYFPNASPVRAYLFKDQLQGNAPFRVDWVGTPCMMVRRSTFAAIGGFPTDFYYWHESVFCSRILQTGGEAWIDPTSQVIHFEGHGGGPRSYRVKKWHIVDFHRGAYRFQVERLRLGRFNALRWTMAAGLSARATLLIVANWLRHQFQGASRV